MTAPHSSRSESNEDPRESLELARVSALLRSLPDPEVPEGLADRVMAEVRRRESRPRVLRLAFAATARPAVSTALAAGLACLAVFATLRGGVFEEERAETPKLLPSVARPIDVAGEQARRPAPRPLVADPVVLYAGDLPSLGAPRSIAPVVEVNSVLARRLDRQLNRLLLNPEGFYRQLERHRDGDALIVRLSDRAAERGDATNVALHLREALPNHPTTMRFVEELFSAVLVRVAPAAAPPAR